MNETTLNRKNNEITFGNYRVLKQMKNIEFKGLLRWFLCGVVFFISEIFFSYETSFAKLIKFIMMFYVFVQMYVQFDSFANSPNFVSTAPVSRKKLVKYDLISFFGEGILELVIFTATLGFFALISGAGKEFIKLTHITKGDIFSWILPFIFLFLIYPLSYVASKKRFYIQSGITLGIYYGISILLCSLSCKGDKFSFSLFTSLNKNFDNLPYKDIIFIASIILLIASFISAVCLSLKNAQNK